MNDDFINQLPIDIHVDKLLEWLISRNHCKRKWFDEYSAQIKKLEEILIKNSDKNNFQEIIGINYFSLEDFIDKNPNNPNIQIYNSILDDLRKNGTGLAGSSCEFARLMTNEMRTMDRNIKELQKNIQNFEKMIESKNRSIETIPDIYQKKCKSLGIVSKPIEEKYDLLSCNVSLENTLLETWNDLPKIYAPFDYFNKYLKIIFKNEIEANVPYLAALFSYIANWEINSTNKEILNNISSQKHLILKNIEFRQELTIELIKLLSFFQQISKSENNENYINIFTYEEGISGQEDNFGTWIDSLDSMIQILESQQVMNPTLIQTSISYRHDIELQLDSIRNQYFDAINSKTKLEFLVKESRENLNLNIKTFKSLCIRAKYLNNKLKQCISQSYKGRTINFFSESNKHLTSVQ